MTRKVVEALLLATVLVFAWMNIDSWRVSRDAQHQFAIAVAAQEKVIAQADATERQQEDNLKNLLKSVADLKNKTRTPSQIIKELPKYLPLPSPISIASAQQNDCVELAHCTSATDKPAIRVGGSKTLDMLPASEQGVSNMEAAKAPVPQAGDMDAKLPIHDLKPLFDFVQDCRTCDAELDAARKASASDSIKISALTRERELAVRAEQGTFWHRVRQNLAWFAIGAIAGNVAAHR